MVRREKKQRNLNDASRKGIGALAGMLLLLGGVVPALAEPAPTPLSLEEARSLAKWVIPAQTFGWIGVQGSEREKPMTVTPGNRFLRILGEHARWYFNPGHHLSLSGRQKTRMIRILVRTRDRLVGLDAKDLGLVQRFEAEISTTSVDIGELGQLNERIGAVEGEEAGVFEESLRSLQGVLTPSQRKLAMSQGREIIPPLSVGLSSAVFLADRILSIRWNMLQTALESDKKEGTQRALEAYGKGRESILVLGTEKTVWDKKADDLLNQPVVDLKVLNAIEKKSGPVEGKFWETLIKVVGTLNPPQMK
ncbi:MAG: hypothetical protein ACYDAM_02095 [Leptospirales bacterium]